MLTVKFITTLLYSIPSMVLYTMSILMVRRFSKDFSSTFVKLYITFYIFNNITFINSFITVRLPQNTCENCTLSFLFKAHSATNLSWFPLHVFYFIHFNMAYVQFFLIFLTSFNRFSMIFWSNSYEKYWNKFFFWLVLIVILLPVPFNYPILLSNVYYVYTDSLDCYTLATSLDRSFIYGELLSFLTTITISTALINITSFYRLSCMTYKISLAERNLLFMSGSLFIVQLLADINTTINRVMLNDSNKDSIWAKIATTLLPYVSDGLTLIHPWMFFAFSTKARRCFMIMYFKAHPQVSTTNNSTHFVSRDVSRRTQIASKF